MIFRKYGNSVHSVEPNFDSRAMNEIGFTKTGAQTFSWEEFQEKYERVTGHELSAKADGLFQDEAEQKVLNELRGQLVQLMESARSGEVVLIESEAGKDYPKTREKQRTIVVGMENKLHFERSVDPPLRVAVYAERVR